MRTTLRILGAAALVAVTLPAMAQGPRTERSEREGAAEGTLLGISLFDTAMKVLNKYGPPDDVQALNTGGGGIGGGGFAGGGAPGGPPAGFGGAPPAATGAGGQRPTGQVRTGPTGATSAGGGWIIGDPFGTGTTFGQRQFGEGPGDFAQSRPPGFTGAGGGAPPGFGGPPPGFGGPGGPPAGFGGPPAGFGGAPGAGGGGLGAANAQATTYIRWVYNRPQARYAFVLNGFGQVIQIEAVGLNDRNVRTEKGVRFGANLQDLFRMYGEPDQYQIAGGSFVMHYLQRDGVAFRLSRVRADQPHCVTGVVLAAGAP